MFNTDEVTVLDIRSCEAVTFTVKVRDLLFFVLHNILKLSTNTGVSHRASIDDDL